LSYNVLFTLGESFRDYYQLVTEILIKIELDLNYVLCYQYKFPALLWRL